MKRFRWILLAAVLLRTGSPAFGQAARAWLDTASMRIGEQVKLHIELSHPADRHFTWPAPVDSLGALEVLDAGAVDTAWSTDRRTVTRSQAFLITGFDSGYYALPPFTFRETDAGGRPVDSIETDPLLLSIHTVAVDTTKAIRDIKGLEAVPFGWRDALPYVLGTLAAAALAWLAILLYRRSQRRKQHVPVRTQPSRPAHEIALEGLRRLDEEKLWQQGNFKAFHTRLTDILRSYIEHRWQVYALEMTTDEILEYPVIYKLPSVTADRLRNILVLADFVKFAKMIPGANDNEQALKNAFDFVLDTRLSAPVAGESNGQTGDPGKEVAV